MRTFFWSDTHFDHPMISELRGFGRDNVADHDRWIVNQWNSVVSPRDTIWLLGDFSFARKEENPTLFNALNGRKHLIRGNHDPAHVANLGWESVSDLKRISVNGQKIVLCHYPMLTWQNAHHGTWHLHGHSHGNLRAAESTRLDVGVDSFRHPISFEQVAEIMAEREYDYIDHHIDN